MSLMPLTPPMLPECACIDRGDEKTTLAPTPIEPPPPPPPPPPLPPLYIEPSAGTNACAAIGIVIAVVIVIGAVVVMGTDTAECDPIASIPFATGWPAAPVDVESVSPDANGTLAVKCCLAPRCIGGEKTDTGGAWIGA